MGWGTGSSSGKSSVRVGRRELKRFSASFPDKLRAAASFTGWSGLFTLPLTEPFALWENPVGWIFSKFPTAFTLGMNFDVNILFLFCGTENRPCEEVGPIAGGFLSCWAGLIGVARTVSARSAGCAEEKSGSMSLPEGLGLWLKGRLATEEPAKRGLVLGTGSSYSKS